MLEKFKLIKTANYKKLALLVKERSQSKSGSDTTPHFRESYSIVLRNAKYIEDFRNRDKHFLLKQVSLLVVVSKFVVMVDNQYTILTLYGSPISSKLIMKIYFPKNKRVLVTLVSPKGLESTEKVLE